MMYVEVEIRKMYKKGGKFYLCRPASSMKRSRACELCSFYQDCSEGKGDTTLLCSSAQRSDKRDVYFREVPASTTLFSRTMEDVRRYLRRKFTISISSIDKDTMHIHVEKKGEVSIQMEMRDQYYTFFSINYHTSSSIRRNSIQSPIEIKFRDKTVTVWAEDGTKKVFAV